MQSEEVSEVEVDQAVRGPGGQTFISKDARDKVYVGSIRLNLGHQKRFRVDSRAIYVAMCAKFGSTSRAVKGISGMAPSVEQTWIIAYQGNKVPEETIGKYINLNNCDILIEDAMKEASFYESNRAEEASKAKAEALRDMTFRIQGLPLNAVQREVFETINGLGFGIDDMNKIRQLYDDFDGQMIRNGIVLFRVSCNNERRLLLAKLMGEYVVSIAGTEWKIKISSFGFCFGCKREGHKIGDCPNKVINCYYCKQVGHERKCCPELARKKENSTCFK